MNAFTLLFILLVLLEAAIRAWLARRQAGCVARHRAEVPAPFRDHIPLQAHQKAADYTIARMRLGLFELAVGGLLLVALTLGGGLDLLDRGWRALELGPVATGTGFLLSGVLLMGLLELPLSAWRTFGIEQRFGFNRTTPALFLADALKSALLLLLLGGPLAWLVMVIMHGAGAAWWIWVWGIWVAFNLFLAWAFPTFIAPLFNRFRPLGDEALRRRIEALLERCGFASRGIFIMDGSRRSSRGNAYFTGLGRGRRVVFFDTLIERLEPAEVEAVLAHELGHFRRRHVLKRMIFSGLLSLAGLALLGWLTEQPGFYAGLGLTHPSPHAALMLFLLVAPLLGLAIQPLAAAVMRRHEFEADDFAARESGPEPLIRALVKLYRDNASTLTPDPLYSAFHDSHPPAPVRIAHLSSKILG